MVLTSVTAPASDVCEKLSIVIMRLDLMLEELRSLNASIDSADDTWTA